MLEVTRKKLELSKSIIGISKKIPLSDIIGGQDSGISVTGILWDDFHAKKPPSKVYYLMVMSVVLSIWVKHKKDIVRKMST